MKDFPFQIN